MSKKPLISVVIPVYNIEDYLEETIDSVVSQSIGVENIEILLVDDGSTDSSGDICLRYAKKYPHNITYIKKENKGVSAARNTGLKEAKGKYVHFLDGDDCISKNFYKESINFLSKNDVDFVAAKVKFFDKIINSHPLNYKFHATRVIDLSVESDAPILHVVSCVFRTESIKDAQFDEGLVISEDMKFLSDILLRKRKYGVVKKPTYHYRKRSLGVSAIGGKEQNRSYYIDTPIRVYEYAINKWRESGDVRPIENTILYDVSYRLEQSTAPALSSRERREYKDTIKQILRQISDESVAGSRFLSIHKKMYILNLIHGNNTPKYINHKGSKVYFKNLPLYDKRENSVFIDFINRRKDNYKIEGYIEGFIFEGTGKIKGTSQASLVGVPRAQREVSFLGDIYKSGGAFEIELPIKTGDKIEIEIDNTTLSIKTGKFSRLAPYICSYRNDRDLLVTKTLNAIAFHKYSLPRHVMLEFRQMLIILTDWKVGILTSRFNEMLTRNFTKLSWKARLMEFIKPSLFTAEAVTMIPQALFLRMAYYFTKPFQRRPIWIISDRGMAAGDNGEALFRYIMNLDDCPADVYFALSKKSGDYNRIKSVGPLLDYGSLRYKLLFLLSDKIISSHADIEVTNPFSRQMNRFVDLYNFNFVFLQHGIIRNDLSGWLNRFDTNISLFVTSARKEYDSILKCPYYYTEDNLVLTGMPRYDYLENTPKGKVVIAPTYRKGLLRVGTNKYGVRPYDSLFRDSQYFHFYNRLITDKRLSSVMKRYNATGELYIHPNFSAQGDDFSGNETFCIKQYPYDYSRAISEGSMLVSDYSSVMFDFAYLEKPVVYAQFDAKEFSVDHSYGHNNFFSDEKDGFGPVVHEYEALVDKIIAYLENGYSIDPKYSRRAKNFFAYKDKRNSERVYDALIATMYNKT